MQALLKVIKTYVVKVFSDMHNAIVGAILAAVFLGGDGIYLYAQSLWQKFINIATLPTPLWATVCTVAIFSIVVSKASTQASYKEPDLKETELSEESVNVLKAISETEEWLSQAESNSQNVYRADFLGTEYLSNKLGLSTQKVQYNFDRLNSAKLIHFYPNREMSGTTPKGRALLHNKGLLT